MTTTQGCDIIRNTPNKYTSKGDASVRKSLIVIICVLIVGIVIFMSGAEKTGFFPVKDKFVNSREGYTLNIPEGFWVDKSFLPHTVRLVSENCVIEVYSQPCNGKDETDSYINYTNSAVTLNSIDYSNVREIKNIGSSVLFWDRKKLSGIKNDRNHYLKIDIPHKDRVYTILVKSKEELSDYRKYKALLDIGKSSGNESLSSVVKYASGRRFNDETREFYNNVFVNSDKVEWGIYQPDFRDMPHIYYIEEHIGHKFNIVLHYTDLLVTYNPTLVRDVLDKAYFEGRTVELTLQPYRDHVGENTLFSVLDGKYDEFLHAYAKDVAEFSHPVLFRLCNEMNGDWCEYSGYKMSLDTELYRELYHYVYNIFKEHNADNVIWVWNPNGKSFPDFEWNHESMYYPGNDYVDVLGLTLYNTGNFYEGEKWIEFDDLYRPLYERVSKEYDMPFMITEFASARKGGNKEKWTRKMLSEIGDYPNIKVAVWWNGADFDADGNISRAYYINDSTEMTDIFKEYFNSYHIDN